MVQIKGILQRKNLALTNIYPQCNLNLLAHTEKYRKEIAGRRMSTRVVPRVLPPLSKCIKQQFNTSSEAWPSLNYMKCIVNPLYFEPSPTLTL